MPLYIDAHLIVDKPGKKGYTEEDIEKAKLALLGRETTIGADDDYYSMTLHDISFIKPTKDLTSIKIQLPALRAKIAHEMGRGVKELDLESLLFLIREVYRSEANAS